MKERKGLVCIEEQMNCFEKNPGCTNKYQHVRSKSPVELNVSVSLMTTYDGLICTTRLKRRFLELNHIHLNCIICCSLTFEYRIVADLKVQILDLSFCLITTNDGLLCIKIFSIKLVYYYNPHCAAVS